jgi:hypothetical protein
VPPCALHKGEQTPCLFWFGTSCIDWHLKEDKKCELTCYQVLRKTQIIFVNIPVYPAMSLHSK